MPADAGLTPSVKALKIALIVLIGGILLLAAIGKLLDNRHFADTLAKWQLFPSRSLLALGVLASLSELGLALWLFSGFGYRLPRWWRLYFISDMSPLP